MAPQRQVAIVTGGSRGIGAEIVRLAAARGYDVAFSYVRDETAARRIESEASANGARVIAIRADVADPSAVATLFATAERELGPVTALVNNAGITGPIGSFLDSTIDTWRRVMDVNVIGLVACAKQAVHRWRERGTTGAMVNISSIAATLGGPGEYVHYAASKAAVEAFTIGLAKEMAATGIRINAVSPGTTYTDIHATAGEPNRPARVVSRIPMQRIAQPTEIAEAVLWLLSPQASYVTGTVLRVAGGL